VSPGQKAGGVPGAGGAQGAHAEGEAPAAPAPQPAHAVLALAPAALAGASGGAHSSGTHAAPRASAAGAGCVPTEHAAGSARHCSAADAPVALVVVPAGQGTQSAAAPRAGADAGR
jgi:hypothetical protein